jgi:ketosteroid isomerase-like protein
MSEENVGTVRMVYEAMSQGDLDTAFEAAEPDLELIPPGQSPSSEPVRGVDGIMAWLTDQQETVGELSLEVEDLIDGEDLVVALLLLRIRPRGSEANLELRIAHLWTLHDGRLIRCEVFPEREKALETAGLSE